jgi:hypothetical protein
MGFILLESTSIRILNTDCREIRSNILANKKNSFLSGITIMHFTFYDGFNSRQD